MVAKVLTAALLLVAFGCRQPPPAPPPAVRLAFPLPDGAVAAAFDAAISPDGRQVAFVATSGGVTRLWRRALDAATGEPIPGTEGARQPAWKQTGSVLSFFVTGSLKQVALADGAVSDLAPASSPSGATWLADGSLLFAPDAAGPIRRMRNGMVTDATTLRQGETGHVFPVASGSDFVYVAVQADGRRLVRLAAGDQEHDLTTTSTHAVLVGDTLLHVQDGALVAYRLDTETNRLPGRGVAVALDVGVADAGHGLFAASEQLLLHAPAAPREMEVAWFAADGTRLGSIGDVGDHWQVRLSSDDRFAAITSVAPQIGTLDIFVVPATGTGDTRRLTVSLSAESAPVWSPDGARVLFRSLHEGVPGLFARPAHVLNAADDIVLESPLDETPSDWRQGAILFQAGRPATGMDVFRLDPRSSSFEPVAATPFNESDARWSPDGRWIAYVSDESGEPDVYVQDARGVRQRVSFGGGSRPRWSRDGRAVLFLRGTEILRTTIDETGRRFSAAQRLFDVAGIVDFDPAHRSDRFLVIRDVRKNLLKSPGAILNWTSLVQ